MRLIDADVLLKELEWLEDDRPVFNDVMRTIDKVPSVDAVPVVRCRDCVWWEKDRECWCEGSKQYHCYLLEICTDENFYCADGREKEDAER